MPIHPVRAAARNSLLVLLAFAVTVLTVGVAPPANAAGTVALSVSPGFFAAKTPTVFTATLDQPLSAFTTSGENLALMLRDETDGSIFAQCGAPDTKTCSAERKATADQPHNIRAYVGERSVDQVVNVKAQSMITAVGWRQFEVSLSMQRTSNGVRFLAVANQDTMDSGYALRIYNTTTGDHLATCSNAVSCGHFIFSGDFNSAHNFVALVAKPDEVYPPSAIASSADGPLREFGPSAANVKGGTVVCQCPTQKSEADPVNTANGMLWERVTDLAVSGRGPAFAFTRNYSAAMASENGPLGYGWTHNYAAKTLTAAGGVVTVVQENGSEVTFTPDNSGGYTGPSNVLAALTPVAGGGTRFTRNSDRTVLTFTSTGRLSTISDRNNETTTLGYNTTGQLVTVTDPAGRVATLTWANGRITGLVDAANRTVSYGYNTSGDLTTVTDVTAKVTTFSYDTFHRLTRMTDPRGGVVTNTFDSDGRVATQTNALGKTATFTYSTIGDINYTNFTNERGITTRFAYWSGLLVEENAAFQTVDEATTVYTYDPKTLGLIAVTDPTERTTTSTYNSRGERTSTTDPLGATTMFTYTPQGDLASSTNALGVTTTLTYNNNGNLTSTSTPLNATVSRTTGYTYGDPAHPGDVTTITDPRGKTTTVAYSPAGQPTATTSPSGAVSTRTYSVAGDLTSVVTPRGNTAGANPNDYRTAFTYDSGGRVTKTTDALGQETLFSYDEQGRLTSTTNPGGGQTSLTYDLAGNVLTETDQAGRTATHTYDETGNRTKTVAADGATTTWTFDAYDNAQTITGPDGNTTNATTASKAAATVTLERDRSGRVLTTTTPNPNSTTPITMSTSYDAAGRPVSSTDPLGQVSATAYDANGNVTSVTNALNETTTLAYDQADRLISVTNAAGNTTGYSYDLSGQQTAVTDPEGNKTTSTFDDDGRLIATVDPRGNVTGANPNDYRTTVGYDPDGNISTVTDPLGHTSSRAYDRLGRLTATTDPNSRTTGYAYNNRSLLTQITNPDGGTVGHTYDQVGNLLTKTSPTGGSTTLAYDTANRPTTVTDPLNRVREHDYDAAGRLTKVTTPRGNIGYGYDTLGRLTGVNYSDSTPDVSYTYDAAGQRLAMIDGTGTTAYNRDPVGRLTAVEKGTTAFGYAYDPAGNLTSRTDPTGTATYGYANNGWPISQTKNNATTNYGYDPAGNLTSTSQPNGASTDVGYDARGQATTVTHTLPGGILAARSYGYDPAGNPTSLATTRNGTTTNRSWTYDQADRLLAECDTTGPCAATAATDAYTYDRTGNRLTARTGTTTVTNAYDAAGQTLTSGSTAFTYDADGNLTGDGQRTYTTDLSGKTATITDPSGSTAYAYNGDGIRTSAATGAATTAFEWDINAPLPELVRETVGTANRDFTYNPDGTPNTVTDGAAEWHYLTDPLGSVTDLIADNGTRARSYDYTPYGQTRAPPLPDTAGAPDQPLGYTGQYTDPTSLTHLRARQYDPTQGRFTSPDPLGGSRDNLAGNSLYAYANNNPLAYSDPAGLWGVPGWQSVKFAWNGTAENGFGDLAAEVGQGVTSFGNGASFGLAGKTADWLSPGAGCEVDAAVENFGAASFFGEQATGLVAGAGVGSALGRVPALVQTAKARFSMGGVTVLATDSAGLYGKAIKPIRGWQTVVIHGNAGYPFFSATNPASGAVITARHVVMAVRSHSTYKPGQGIRLIACFAGAGGSGCAAQAVANASGGRVSASKHLLRVYEDGFVNGLIDGVKVPLRKSMTTFWPKP